MRAFTVIHQSEDGNTSTLYTGVDGVVALKTYRDYSSPGKTFLFDSLHAKSKRIRPTADDNQEPEADAPRRRGRPPKYATA